MGVETIERRFAECAPTSDQVERAARIRDAARELALFVGELTPTCRQQSLAITKIEEAVHWAEAALFRGPETAPQGLTTTPPPPPASGSIAFSAGSPQGPPDGVPMDGA